MSRITESGGRILNNYIKDFKAGVVDCLNGTDREPPQIGGRCYDARVGYDAGFLFGREVEWRHEIKNLNDIYASLRRTRLNGSVASRSVQ